MADEQDRGDRVRRRYEHGYAQIPRLLLAHQPPPTAHAVHTFAMLDMHADRATGACFPALATLAREMGVSRRTVQRALDDLERLGFVERIPRMDPRYGRVGTDYVLGDTPVSPVTRGGRTGGTPLVTPVAPKQKPERNKHQYSSRGHPAAAHRPAASDVDAVNAMVLAIVPGADVSAVPQWTAQHGVDHVAQRVRWLEAVLAAGSSVESPMGWLHHMLTVDEPPLAYRRRQAKVEREARRQAQRQGEAAQREQVEAERQVAVARMAEARRWFEGLAPSEQDEVDRRARAAVPAQLGEPPMSNERWVSRVPAAALWRQGIMEQMGTSAADYAVEVFGNS